MQYSIVEMHNFSKIHSFNIQKPCLSMFSNAGQNRFIFFSTPSRLFTAYSTFPWVKKMKKKLYLYLPTSRPYKIGLGKIREPINQITFA